MEDSIKFVINDTVINYKMTSENAKLIYILEEMRYICSFNHDKLIDLTNKLILNVLDCTEYMNNYDNSSIDILTRNIYKTYRKRSKSI